MKKITVTTYYQILLQTANNNNDNNDDDDDNNNIRFRKKTIIKISDIDAERCFDDRVSLFSSSMCMVALIKLI